MSINRVMISGNLTRDPELRQTQGGTTILSFGVAVNDRRRNQQTGEWEDYPNFIDCVMFGTRAEALNRILSKGMKVAIEGKLRYSSWEREGQRRSKIEVIVDEIEFMSSRQGGQGMQSGQNMQGGQAYDGGAPQYVQPTYAAPAPPQPTYAVPAQQTQYVQQAPQAPQRTPEVQPMQPQPQAQGASVPPSPDVYDEDIPF